MFAWQNNVLYSISFASKYSAVMMKLTVQVLGLLAAISLTFTVAQNEFLEALPDCAVGQPCFVSLTPPAKSSYHGIREQYDCLLSTEYTSACILTDQGCLCVNPPLRDRIILCVSTTCSIPDSFCGFSR